MVYTWYYLKTKSAGDLDHVKNDQVIEFPIYSITIMVLSGSFTLNQLESFKQFYKKMNGSDTELTLSAGKGLKLVPDKEYYYTDSEIEWQMTCVADGTYQLTMDVGESRYQV